MRVSIMVTVALFSAAMATAEEEGRSEAFRECLERYADNVCKPFRDEGNMNSACSKAVADCSEQASDKGENSDSDDDKEGSE